MHLVPDSLDSKLSAVRGDWSHTAEPLTPVKTASRTEPRLNGSFPAFRQIHAPGQERASATDRYRGSNLKAGIVEMMQLTSDLRVHIAIDRNCKLGDWMQQRTAQFHKGIA